MRKLGLILNPGDPADLYSCSVERGRYLFVLNALPLSALGIWLLALPGLVIALRRDFPRTWPPAAFAALHVAVLLLFFVSTRLRLPLRP